MVRTLAVLIFSLVGIACGLDNSVGRTPMMGWMAWIRFRCNTNCDEDPENCVSEKLIKGIADTLVQDGWKDAGYEYVSIDDVSELCSYITYI